MDAHSASDPAGPARRPSARREPARGLERHLLWACDRLPRASLAEKTSRHSEDIGWLFGFISGYNEFDNIPKRPFLSQDEANLQKAIDQRCAASPDKLVKERVLAFVNGLNKSENAKKPPPPQ